MAITHASHFAHAQRTLFIDYRDPAQRIGGVFLGPPNGSGKIPFMLPFTKVIANGVEYLETNPFVGRTNTANEFDDVFFHQTAWGEIAAVESRTRLEYAGQDNPSGSATLTAGPIDVHKFGWI